MERGSQALLDLYFRARAIAFRYRLDIFEASALEQILATFDQGRAEVFREFGAKFQGMSDWKAERLQSLLESMDDMTLALRQTLSGQYVAMAATAGGPALAEAAAMLTVGGLSHVAVNAVDLTQSQLQAFFQSTPLSGRRIDKWVDASFDATVQAQIRQAINVGVIKGEGYPGLVKRVEQGMGMARNEAVTLTRTFVSAANNEARDMVFKANPGVVKGWKWLTSGDNLVCPRCLALHGCRFDVGKGPPIPLHPRCRCNRGPATITMRELGIPIDEFQGEMDRWVVRGKKGADGELVVRNIDAGNRNAVVRVSRAKDADAWFQSLSDAEKRATTLGPGRVKLLEEGKIGVKDLLREDFTQRTLEELNRIADGGR
jgi:SPP1 gp7 family putative phage head morphogenesis protein